MTIKDPIIGADIEVFVQHKETKEIVSAENFIQGTKDEPFNFDPTNKFWAISKDNVLAEFCIPPAPNKLDFYNYIRKSLGYINKILPKEYCTAAIPAYSLDSKWLQTDQAKLFGCEPDYNAYTGLRNIAPHAEDQNLRSAGLHIHFGYSFPTPYNAISATNNDLGLVYQPDEERLQIIRAADLFLGVPSVIMEPANKRKELYGKAGAFRPKPYGVEYRTLSNYFVQQRKLTLWVYEAAMASIAWLNEGNIIDNLLGNYVQKCINTSDKEVAEELIKTFELKIA